MSNPLKLQLLDSLQQELHRMCNQAIAGAHEAQQEANYHIGAMQSRYDTFKEEAQYLTDAQKLRLLTLRGQLQECVRLRQQLLIRQSPYHRLQLGALVTLRASQQGSLWLFVAPAGLGKPQETASGRVICVTPEAPLISPGLGLSAGDEYQVSQGGSSRSYCIVDIQ